MTDDEKQREFGRRLVAKLREWRGSEYRRQGIEPAFGMDCLGSIIAAARECGLDVGEPNNWKAEGTAEALDARLRKYCAPVPFAKRQIGDFVAMGRGNIRHAGIVCVRYDGTPGILHCDKNGLHESELRTSLPVGQGNAVAPVQRVYRARPQLIDLGE